MKDQRKGRIKIHTTCLEDWPLSLLAQAFAKISFFPVRAEHFFVEEAIVYDGYSPHFEEVPFGHVIPEYNLIISTHKNELGEVGLLAAEVKQK